MFGIDLKYIVILLLIALAIFSGIKKLFKLALTILVLGVLYYIYLQVF